MSSKFRIDTKTGALIFQTSPEEKNLQEYLEGLNIISSTLSHILSQNKVIIEQNDKILQLLSSKGGSAEHE